MEGGAKITPNLDVRFTMVIVLGLSLTPVPPPLSPFLFPCPAPFQTLPFGAPSGACIAAASASYRIEQPRNKAFSPKRGLVLTVNGASAPSPPTPGPRPRPPFLLVGGGGFTENSRGGFFQDRGGRARGVYGGEFWGGGGRGRRGPIYRENEPPFRRKRLKCRKQEKITLPQKESGKRSLAKKVTKQVTEASEKVTERVPKTKSDRTPFADLLCGTLRKVGKKGKIGGK